jgi:glycosyltransferase involved in cell wall biosynthesis
MNQNHQARLAIVIPAWRALHFTAALTSLRTQTDRRFRLYIGDDGSPDDLRSIVESAGAGLDIVYHRFPANLGGQDLIAHWHRCIALTQNEPWIWVFSDDDIAEPECVASFYKLIDSGAKEAALLRFNTVIIDGSGEITRTPTPHPSQETAFELFNAIIDTDSRAWHLPDHIFSRSTYLKIGGFVNFPKALFSDYATWILFAEEGAVYTIPNARIRFRRYEQGTSSGMLDAYRPEFFTATGSYVEFIIATSRRLAPGKLNSYSRLIRKYGIRAIFRSPSGIKFGEAATIANHICKQRNLLWIYYFKILFYALRTWLRARPFFQAFAQRRLRHSRR